jgi:Fe-S cluster assembly ATPase SufC
MLKELSNENNSLIIITHYFKILEFIDVDKVYVMKDGDIIFHIEEERLSRA